MVNYPVNHLRREKIGDGAHINIVTDPRYKFNRITIAFFTRLGEDTASANALIPRLLSKSNVRYPEPSDFSNYLASLYNAKCDFGVDSFGDAQVVSISMNFMDDNYALSGEKITQEAAQAVFDCMFRPAFEKGVFASLSTETGKREQTEAIEVEINDKRLYAANRAGRIICRGEPAAVNPLGSTGSTKIITPDNLYAAYKELLKSAVTEIVCVGCNDFSDAVKIAKREFSALKRENIQNCESVYSPLKAEPEVSVERLPINQSKMVLGFKTNSKNHAALTLMSNLYGGTISSKLFLNVREKLSLCYYCWSRVYKQKGVMNVSCGVDEAKIDEAKAEILTQFENVKNGDFTDDDLKYALLSEQNNIKTVADNLSAMTWWYITRIYAGEIKSPGEFLRNYDGITRNDIIEAANSFALDTFYVLSGLDGQGEEKDAD